MKIKKNQVESVFPALIKLSTNLAMKSKWGPFIKIWNDRYGSSKSK